MTTQLAGNNVAFVWRGTTVWYETHRAPVYADRDVAVAHHVALVWIGTTCIDIGAFTPCLCCIREQNRTTFSRLVGALDHECYARWRHGAEVPDGWMDGLNASFRFQRRERVGQVLSNNGIWWTYGDWWLPARSDHCGMSGACSVHPVFASMAQAFRLRTTDLRFDSPCFQWRCLRRYLVRLEEMRQSIRFCNRPCSYSRRSLMWMIRGNLPPKTKATSRWKA